MDSTESHKTIPSNPAMQGHWKSWIGERILWVDWMGAALVGVTVVMIHPWLARLYSLPDSLILALGIVNLAYGSYSFTLCMFQQFRTKYGVYCLIFANVAWLFVCIGLCIAYSRHANLIGMAQLLGEGVYVAALGVVEWSVRDSLIMPPVRRQVD
jgi:hypothetical protein